VNPFDLSSESSDPPTWGTGVKKAIHNIFGNDRAKKQISQNVSQNIWNKD